LTTHCMVYRLCRELIVVLWNLRQSMKCSLTQRVVTGGAHVR